MPVNNTPPEYDQALPDWLRARDVLVGEDAVTSAGEKYLPRLDSQSDEESWLIGRPGNTTVHVSIGGRSVDHLRPMTGINHSLSGLFPICEIGAQPRPANESFRSQITDYKSPVANSEISANPPGSPKKLTSVFRYESFCQSDSC